MKIIEYVTKKQKVEVSVEEAAKNFIASTWYLTNDLSELEYEIEDYLRNEVETYTEEEINEFTSLIKEHNEKIKEDYRNQEIDTLRNRNSIISFLDESRNRYDIELGDTGYFLTSEEILDLILKNGNK